MKNSKKKLQYRFSALLSVLFFLSLFPVAHGQTSNGFTVVSTAPDSNALNVNTIENIAFTAATDSASPGMFPLGQQTITTAADGAQSVTAADLDGDGDLDVLSASFNDARIAWYENDGTGGVGAPQTITTAADGAISVTTADLDGDGDLDVLSASADDNRIAWYENDGTGGFGAQQTITTAASAARSVTTADLDGDGDLDVLSASFLVNPIAWYENDGTGGFGVPQTITTVADFAFSVTTADLDGDGDLDVLSASFNDDRIAWNENDGTGSFGAPQTITTDADGAFSVTTADLDGDGDLDVLSASIDDDRIAWYENDGTGGFGMQQTITTVADCATNVTAADLDGDGDLDVLSASANDDRIAWYENDGTGGFGAQQTITTAADGAQSVTTADLDGDGDLDVLSASAIDSRIAWYENALPGVELGISANTGTEAAGTVITLTATASQAVSGDQTVDIEVDVNGTGITAGDFSLSNTTITILGGETEGSVIFTVQDDGLVEGSETANLTISNPSSGVVLGSTVSQNIEITDNDSAAVTITDVSGNENGGAITMTATLDNAVQGGFTVNVSTADGPATIADSDYTAVTNQTLTFVGTAGEEQTFTVTPTGDTKLEADETLTVSQSNLAATTLSVTITDGATVTITNDDAAAVTIAGISGNENDGAITVTATLDNAVQGGFTVDVNTADGTATTADSDYTAVTSETLTFAGTVGETQTFTITPTGDTKLEADETVTVSQNNLAATSLGVVITDSATVTITNDDFPSVALSVSATAGTEGAGTVITVTATASQAVVGNQTMGITVTGTGITAGDFTLSNSSITISDGATTGSVTFTILNDGVVEGIETATLTLNTPSGGITLGSPISQNIIIELPPTFTKTFSPDVIPQGGISTLTFTIDNSANTLVASDLDFTNNLPAAIVLATPANASTNCVGGDLTANDGTGLLVYIEGVIAAGSRCTIQVDVTSTTIGMHVNTTSALTSSSGNSGPATDTLEVTVVADPTLSLSFIDDPITLGDTVTLSFTITNTDTAVGLSGISFTNDLTMVLPGLVATGLPQADVCGAGSSINGADMLTFTNGSLAPAQSCTFTVPLQTSVYTIQNQYFNHLNLLQTAQHPEGVTVNAVAALTIGGNILLQDSDRDGLTDAVEALLGLNPNDRDSDNDGILDSAEDNDGDNVSNRNEVLLGFDPTDPTSTPTASFTDVDGFDQYFAEIEILNSQGFIVPCEGSRFCPTNVILRDQSAKWLSETYNVFVGQPSAQIETGSVFDDVPFGTSEARFIEDLDSLGIDISCAGSFGSPGFLYCPRRVEIKSEAVRTILLTHSIAAGFPIPFALFSPYLDVDIGPPSDFAADEIVELFSRGHGGSCNETAAAPGNLFCPRLVLTKEEYASILVWVFELRPIYSELPY